MSELIVPHDGRKGGAMRTCEQPYLQKFLVNKAVHRYGYFQKSNATFFFAGLRALRSLFIFILFLAPHKAAKQGKQNQDRQDNKRGIGTEAGGSIVQCM